MPRARWLATLIALTACAAEPPPAPTPLEGHTLLVSVAQYDDDATGLAAAAREGEFDVRDLYGTIVLQRGVIEIAERDVAEFVGIPAPWEWGDPEPWIVLGDGIRIVGVDEDEGAAACLTWLGAFDDFPVYVASNAMGFDGECAAPDGALAPKGIYNLEIFADPDEDQGDDAVLVGAVVLPPAPDIDAAEVVSNAIEMAWSGSGDDDTTLLITAEDRYGNTVAVETDDDGEEALPAEAVDALERGTITLTVSRSIETPSTWSGADVIVHARVERRTEVVLP